MKFGNKNKAIFNSDEKNEYKEKQIIWWCTTLLCTLFPFLAQLISAVFSHKLDLISIINNGELVLLTYSITIPTLIDLIQLETKKNATYVIYVLFWIFIILSDLVIYLSMKNVGMDMVNDNFIINLNQ